MNRFPKFGLVLALGALISLPVMALASLVNFDDISTPNNSGGALWGTVPANYLGWTWTGGWEVQDNTTFKSVYNNTGDFPSLPNAAYNDTGAGTVSISFPSIMTVEGAYFRSWSQNNAFQSFSANTLTVKGYLGSTEKYTQNVNLTATGMVYTALNFAGIDQIQFGDGQGKWWLTDNMSVVPIPSALLLLSATLTGIVGVRKKIKK